MLERVLFGDNQFFGINHMSEEKARAQAIRFRDVSAVLEVLDASYEEGIKVFMCTTHDRVGAVCDHIRAHRERYKEFTFYPCMPYAHKYANAVTEYGTFEALRRFLPEQGAIQAMLRGGASIVSKDVEGIARLLIDAEMKMFAGLRTPVIFLQNVVTDLLLGLGAHEGLRIFAQHVRERYGAEPGFITMNLMQLLDALDQVGIDNPIVCFNMNKIGFRMSGGLRAYEEAIATRKFRPIAMSIFASGAIPPREAVEYVCRHKNVRSIVFGASSRRNIRQTKELIESLTIGSTAAGCPESTSL